MSFVVSEKVYLSNVFLRSCNAIESYQASSGGNRPRDEDQKGDPNYRVEKVVARHDVWDVGSLRSYAVLRVNIKRSKC